MQKKASRIIVDTNLWISFLIAKNFTKLDDLIFSGKVKLIFSQDLIDEFLDVVRRPKIGKYISPTLLEELLEVIEKYADFIVVKSNVEVCRDPKDNFLLVLAVDGQAHFLLTGDKDLLELKKFANTKIITLSDFLKSKASL